MLSIILAGYLFNTAIYFYLIRIVHRMTTRLFDSRIAAYTTLIFIFNPSSIFFHVLYTECLFCLLVFLGLEGYLATFQDISIQQRALSMRELFSKMYLPGLLLSLSILVRSNGLFFLTVPALVLLKQLGIMVSLPRVPYGQVVLLLLTGLLILA